MSGHSKWANIKHRKAAADAKKGKVFTRLIKEITVAARLGGADVNANPRLRLAMGKSRYANMTKDSVHNAMQPGSAQLDAGGEDWLKNDGGSVELICTRAEFDAVKAALDKAGVKAELSEVAWKPTMETALPSDQQGRMRSLVDAVENLDDVQNVHTTAVID